MDVGMDEPLYWRDMSSAISALPVTQALPAMISRKLNEPEVCLAAGRSLAI